MPEMDVNRSDTEDLAQEPDSTGPEPTEEPPPPRRSGRQTPVIAAGLAALALAGPVAAGHDVAAAGDVISAAGDSISALRDQFAKAFTAGPVDILGVPEGTIKLDG
jgi:hypothetical protein